MSFSRRALLVLPGAVSLASAAAPRSGLAQATGAPPVIDRFYNELLAVMREGKRLSFDQRYARLAPAVGQTFDLGLMTRIAVGPGWAQIAADQQQRLVGAFTKYTVSNYANRFDDYSGERFEVSPTPGVNANGTIVETRIVKSTGEPVSVKYLMHQDGAGGWKVIDIYLSGTISELATRRSEFASVLQRSGAEGLVQLLEQRSAALRAG